ncbi:MAG: transglutaminase family protein [Limnoraphis sp. WC205]|jgi:transglutaminase-like putative cysteine protease|nr:transglutaminase family protein [Limnoraphis sp. WC205]
MDYQIVHTTTYTYSQAVDLAPHLVRLRPRSDAFQTLQSFSIDVTPSPLGQSDIVDLGGNDIIKLWFKQKTETLNIKVSSHVQTHCINPFNYLLESWALELPITDYPVSLFAHLQPYLQSSSVDPIMPQLAQEIWQTAEGSLISFLNNLNQRIYQTCRYIVRETGAPLPPGVTWTQQMGSCRDLAVVFIEACRAVGIPARFVSGYQEGDVSQLDRHLHAWAEVYLPGAGWHGYDPTQGLAVSDRHIALVATAIPREAAPVTGSFRGVGAKSQIDYTLSINPSREER